LFEVQAQDDVAHRTLLQRQIIQNLAPSEFGHRVEGVRGGSGSWHEKNYIFLYGNM
jgi:hypothetical protein